MPPMLKTFAGHAAGGRRPTIHDVAQRAGVSITTVSRALRGHRHVRVEVRERVVEAAQTLGYAPDRVASGLRTRKTGVVAFLGRNITNPVIAGVAWAADRVLAREGYLTVVANAGGWPGGDSNLLAVLLERRVDGIMGYIEDEYDEETRRALSDAQIPVVLIDRRIDGIQADQITADHAVGTEHATRYLVQRGHRRIGLVTAPIGQWTGRERRRGYAQALTDNGLDAESYARHVTPDLDLAQAAVEDLLRQSPRPTAIIGGGNRVSAALLRAVRAAGLRIPDDLSVIVFGGFDLLDITSPSLAHVTWSLHDVGEAAANRLLARLRGDQSAPHLLSFPTRFEPRGSVGPPPV
jgi:LacI family transcriptional regulator